ncbi:vomeronasal type-2 receptor 1-like [Latimeria chalumnae]|uniref:vomeronasal type-2 receptor 1-like n=1 Tax=Latimeria chalumnae TaxID=7897 RepID=UPI00313ED39C
MPLQTPSQDSVADNSCNPAKHWRQLSGHIPKDMDMGDEEANLYIFRATFSVDAALATGTQDAAPNFPHCYYAEADILSDRHQFPSFFRTLPRGKIQSIIIVKLLVHFGWTWVGMLIEDTEFGELSLQDLKDELAMTNVCIGFLEKVPIISSPIKINHTVDVIKKSTVNVIMIICYDGYLVPLMEEVSRQNITGKIWVATASSSTSKDLFKTHRARTLTGTIGIAFPKSEIPGFQDFLINLYPSVSQHNMHLEDLWEDVFGCKWLKADTHQTFATSELQEAIKFCTGRENLDELNIPYLDMSELRVEYNVYNAVYAVAHALHDLYTCEPGKGPFSNGSCANIHDFEPWQRGGGLAICFRSCLKCTRNLWKETSSFEYMIAFCEAKVNFKILLVYRPLQWNADFFDELLELISFLAVESPNLIVVGKINARVDDTSDNLARELSHIMQTFGFAQFVDLIRSKIISDFSCCGDDFTHHDEAISRVLWNSFSPVSDAHIIQVIHNSSYCQECPYDHWSNDRQDKCIPKSIEFLSFKEPLGIIIVSITVPSSLIPAATLYIFIRYHETPIVKANNCELSYLLLLALVLCFLCSLIFIGEPMIVTCILRQITFGIIFAFSVSCVLAKTIMVVIAFKATNPNSNLKKWVGLKLPNTVVFACTLLQVIICMVWLTTSPPFPEKNMNSEPGKIIIECNEGSTVAFSCMLGYMGLLAIVSFIVAFLARNLPNNFNEAKFITFSMLVFVSVWLSFIPAYLSTKGKYMVAVEIFAILASSAGLLACIFFPKCYIILLKPEINTQYKCSETRVHPHNAEHQTKLFKWGRNTEPRNQTCTKKG